MLIWVFGGSAVGKKHFITHATQYDKFFNGFTPTWMNDGELSAEQLQTITSGTNKHLIRWQWRRELTLGGIVEQNPQLPQQLILVSAPVDVVYQRAIKREAKNNTGNEDIWTEDSLSVEARSVKWLVLGIAAYYKIPLTEICVESKQPKNWTIKGAS